MVWFFFFFFKQKTAYEMRISDWSSDVCSSDLTSFEIGAPRLSATTIGTGGSVTVSVDVANTGKVAGDEVVQLYIRDKESSVTQPVKELKGFRRVTLAPGEKQTISFTLTPRSLSLWNIDMKRVVEPGAFDIMVGPDSRTLKTDRKSTRLN